MMKTLAALKGIIAIAFAIQSLVVSFAMINKQLTVPFLMPGVTVAAGWITLILVIVAIIFSLFRIAKLF
ncbi:MAG: hypothetical protein QW165_02660 [Candidatus Woesearchaeota archaeon]